MKKKQKSWKKNNFKKKGKKTKIKRKQGKVSKKKKALWITVVIHSVLCVGEQ